MPKNLFTSQVMQNQAGMICQSLNFERLLDVGVKRDTPFIADHLKEKDILHDLLLNMPHNR